MASCAERRKACEPQRHRPLVLGRDVNHPHCPLRHGRVLRALPPWSIALQRDTQAARLDVLCHKADR
eukprot:13008961-Alexandrium_andersonii.AAC.1